MPFPIRSLLACTSIALVSNASAQGEIHGEIVHFGRCDPGSTMARYAQPQAPTGYASRGNLMIGKESESIPLVKNIGFGYYWKAAGLPSEFKVTYRIVHPPIVGVDGRREGEFEETRTFTSADGTFATADCYFLTEDREVVAGDWTIQVLVNGRPLVGKTFHVTADEAP